MTILKTSSIQLLYIIDRSVIIVIIIIIIIIIVIIIIIIIESEVTGVSSTS